MPDRGDGPGGIDRLVSELYGLTDEQIRMVEEGAAAGAKQRLQESEEVAWPMSKQMPRC